jgi:hypothetical protein
MALNLLELIIGKKYLYQSNLDKVSFITKIKALIEENGAEDKPKTKPFVGRVDENTLLIRENVMLLQAFSTYFDAKIEGNEDGCRLSGRIRISRWIAMLLSFVLLFLIIVSAFFVYLSGMNEWIDLIMLIPVFIFFMILVMIFISINQETNQLEEILLNKINF